jgi:hypothetical protein
MSDDGANDTNPQPEGRMCKHGRVESMCDTCHPLERCQECGSWMWAQPHHCAPGVCKPDFAAPRTTEQLAQAFDAYCKPAADEAEPDETCHADASAYTMRRVPVTEAASEVRVDFGDSVDWKLRADLMQHQRDKYFQMCSDIEKTLTVRVEQAEAKCAELAAALAYIDEKCQLYGSSDAARGRIRIVLNDPSALLLAYRAQVERETLERVKDIACGHACVKYHGLCECGPAIAGEIEAEFAPKEDPARGFDESQLRRGKINDKRD